MANIKIDRLELHLNGISKQKAQNITSGLGAEILRQLSNRNIMLRNRGPIRLDKITLDSIRSNQKSTTATLRKEIGNRIAQQIALRSETE